MSINSGNIWCRMCPQKFNKYINHRIGLLQQLQDADLINRSAVQLSNTLRQGGKILLFGNGGSATQACHFAAELVNRFKHDRQGLAAIALNTDIAALTSIANDSDYKFIFSRQIEALGRAGDFAIGLSTSGSSANVIEGFKMARERRMLTMCLCGAKTEAVEPLKIDSLISVPSTDTPAIQEIHLFILHYMAEEIELQLLESMPGNPPGQ